MKGERIQEIGTSLGITRKDLRSLKRRRFGEHWTIPILGSMIAIIGPLLGKYQASRLTPDKNYNITSRTGDGYPYSMGSLGNISFLSRIMVLPLTILFPSRNLMIPHSTRHVLRWKRFLQITFIACAAIISYYGYHYAYELAHPPPETIDLEIVVEIHQDTSIDYGVFSHEELLNGQ